MTDQTSDPFPWAAAFSDDDPAVADARARIEDAVVADDVRARAAELSDAEHFTCHRDGDRCTWAGCPMGNPPEGTDLAPCYLAAPELSEQEREVVERITAAPAAFREPYVGQGADGARRSAEIDRNEIETLDRDDPRIAELTASANAWEAQAADLDEQAGPTVDDLPPGDREILDELEDESVEPEPTKDVVPRGMVLDVDGVLDELASTTVRTVTTRTMRDAIVNTVRVRASERQDARVKRLGDDPPKDQTDLRVELVGAANDHDVLSDLAATFAAGAKEAKGIAGELIAELPGRGGKPRRSARVGDGEGFELSVTVSPGSKLSTVDSEIDDVLAALAIAQAANDHKVAKDEGREAESILALQRKPAQVYAAGVRAGIAALRDLLGATPGYKSTALDALVIEAQNMNEDELAKRLRAAYGKKDVGEPAVKLDRKPVAPKDEEKDQ